MAMTEEQMIKEMAVFVGMDAAKSPALDRAVPKKPVLNADAAIDVQFEQLGLNKGAIDSEIAAEKNKARQDMMEKLRQDQESTQTKIKLAEAAGTIVQGAAGIGVGVQDILRNTFNGVVTLADSVENYAASKGLGTGDLISDTTKIQTSYGADDLDKTGKISRAVTNFAAPLLTTIASGGGALAASGVGAAYNFFALDPKSERISDLLKGTAVDEVPIAADVIDYLSTKPDDTELTARFKNLAEGLGVEAALAGMLWGASRAYSSIARVRNPKVLEDMAKETQAAQQALENIQATPVTPAEQAAVNASDVAVSTPRDGGALPVQPTPPPPPPPAPAPAPTAQADEQFDLFSKQWSTYFDESPGVKVAPETGEVSVRLGDDQLVGYLANAIKDPEIALSLSKPTTDADLLKGANYIKNDPDVLNRLASIGVNKDYVPNSNDMMALKFIMSKADEAMTASATAALQGGDAELVGFARDMDNYFKILSVQTGAASEQGRTLRVNQILAKQAGMGSEEAMKAIGAQGRAKLVDGLVNKYGGRDNIKQMATNVKFIKELSDIQALPNEAFKARMNDVVKLTGWMKVEDAITKVALNSMLYSPKIWSRAFILNAATTSKTVLDNYVSVGIGKAFNSADAKSLAEANAHLKASFMGLFDGVQPAAESIRTGVPGNARIVKEELAMATNKNVPVLAEEFTEKAGGAWAEKLGVVVNNSVEAPARILIGIDTYWQHVNSRGVIASEAVRAGMKNGLTGDALVNFVERYRANPPTEVLRMADEVASKNTMSKNLTGFAESIDNGFKNAGDYVPFIKVVMPFMKTGFNVVEYTVQNSPLAPLLSQDFKMAVRTGGRARDEAVAKVVSSTTAIAGLVALAENGMIVGEATDNAELKSDKAFKDNKTVNIGTSVRVGDTWVSLRGLEPLSTAANIAVLMSKARGYVSAGQYDDLVNATRIMLADAVGPEGLTTGLSDILNLANPNKDPKQYLANVVTRFVPYGAALRDVRELVDPKVRSTMPTPGEGKTAELQEFYSVLKNRLSNMVPYLSKTLPVERNIWGEGLMLPDGLGPDAISPVATTTNDGMALKNTLQAMDDFYEMNRDVIVGISKFPLEMPAKQLKNPMADVQYKFTPREYSAYVLLNAGINPTTGDKLLDKTLKERVQETLIKYDAFGKKPQQYNENTYRALTGELSQIFLQHKKIADKMILQYGDVQNKMVDQARRKNNLEGAINGGQ